MSMAGSETREICQARVVQNSIYEGAFTFNMWIHLVLALQQAANIKTEEAFILQAVNLQVACCHCVQITPVNGNLDT